MKKHYNLKAITQGVKAFAALLLVAVMFVGNVFAEEVTYVFSEQGFTNTQVLSSGTINENISFVGSQGSSSTAGPAYYTSGAAARFYFASNGEGNAMTLIPATGTIITGLEITTLSTYIPTVKYVVDGGEEATATLEGLVYTISNVNAASSLKFYNANTTSKQLRATQITVYYTTGAIVATVPAPAISPISGTYYGAQTVSISAQNGATIYYTTDGTTPNVNSTVYTEPFTVNATTTVKAIAVQNEDISAVATSAYTINIPVEVANIAAFKAVDNTDNVYKITGDVTVIGQYSNKYHTFIQDNTGALYIYGTMAHNYNPGDVISGGVYGTYALYNGLKEMKPVADLPSAEGVAGTPVQPIVVTLAALNENYADYEGKLVTVYGVTAAQDRTFGTANSTKGATITQNDATAQIYNTWGAITNKQISEGDVLNVTGYVIRYNDNVEIVPRSNNDVIMAIAELPYTLDFDNNVDDGFIIDNATATNKWYVGQATGFDNNKLFVSNNGATNKYINTASNAYAYRTIRIPEAGAILSFDYRVMGENNYDYLKVAIVKDGNETVLATLNGTNDWNSTSLVIAPSLAGVVDLVFTWTNDASGSNQFPAAVDNISIIENPCAQPTNLAATVSGTTATITWTPGEGQNAWVLEYKPANRSEWHTVNTTNTTVTLSDLTGNTDYNVRVKANCEAANSVWVNANFAVDCQNLTVMPADVEVGTGTVSGYYAPFNNYYKNSWNQCVYPASEIGSAGNIYSIAWNCAATASLTLSNVKIYLGTTSHSTVTSTSDWLPMSELTLVYEGNNVAIGSSTGWETYTLNAPFYYNGTDNLVVVVSKTASSYSSSIKYYYTSVTNSMMYRQSDGDASYAQHPGSSTGTRSTYRANIKLNMDAMVCGDVPACTEPTNLTVSNITTSEAEIAWTAGDDETAWTVEYRPANSENWTSVQTTESNYMLNGLNAGTPYVVRVAANCGNTVSEYIVANFTTEASCLVPSNIVNVNNMNNTNLYWTANNGETAWVVEFKEASATEWVSLNVINEPTIALANLSNSTLYDVRVKAVCDENNASAWVNYQFTSDCSFTELPYVEDFERFATNTQPDCWTSLNNTWPTNSWPMVYVNSTSTYVHNGSRSLYFKSSSTTPVYSIMPVFNAQNIKVTFFYRNEGTTASNGILSIGTMSDPTDESTFVEERTFDRTTTFTEETVNFINLNGARVAFRYTGGTANNYYLGIDDITVEEVSNCVPPTQIAVSNITTTTADMAWTAGNEENSWQIEYGATGFAHGTGTVVTVNAPAYAFTGLTAGVTYDVYVRSICGANDNSEWSEVATFATAVCEEADKCTFTLNMTDSYGDGWNGNYILVEVDGEYYDEFTVESGSTQSATIKICDNQTFTLTWENGSYADECSYELVKDGEILYSSSDAKTGVFYTQNGCSNEEPPVVECSVELPYFESFEPSSEYLNCWTIIDNNGDGDAWNFANSNPNTGSYAARIYTDYNNGNDDDYLITPAIILTGNQYVSFYTKANSTSEPNAIEVLLSTTGKNPADFTTTIMPVTTIGTTTYQHFTYDLSAYTGTAYIAFHAPTNSLDGWYLYVDDVEIGNYLSCYAPENITVSNITDHSAQISWTPVHGETNFAVEYKLEEDAVWNTVMVQGTSTTLNLVDGSKYMIRVKAVCGADDESDYTSVITFSTPCLGGADVTIGTGTSKNNGYVVNNYYKYSYSQQIYKASEIGIAGNINSFAVDYAYSSAMTAKNNVEVYMGLTNKTSFSSTSDWITNGLQLVYSGSLNCSQGWNTFTLDAPFAYDGTSNLVLVVKDMSNGYNSSSYTFNTTSTDNQYLTMFYYSDSNPFSGTQSASSRPYYRNNIKFSICPPSEKDLELVSVQPIADACDLSNAQLTIQVKNKNTVGEISSFTASYQINGGAVISEVVNLSTPIAIGATYDYTFVNAPVFVDAVNNVDITVTYTGDGNEDNNALTLGPIHLMDPINIPYSENFSNVVLGQGGWTVGARNANPVMWSVVNGTPTYTFSDEFNASSYMVSPCLYIPAGQTMISYDYNALDVLPENLVVYVGTSDQPADWTPIGQHNNFTHSNNAYHVDYNFNNTESGVYFIIVKAASVRGSMGVTFDNLNINQALTVNINAGANGTTDPSGELTVAYGDDLNINIFPNAGYYVSAISVNGITSVVEENIATVYPFTLSNITENTTVDVAFASRQYKVVKTAITPNGTFVPATTDLVNYGDAHTVTAVAAPHHHLTNMTVRNNPVLAGVNVTNDLVVNGTSYSYTFDHVYADKYVTASFRIDTVGIFYTVDGGQGTIENRFVVSDDTEIPAHFSRYIDYGTGYLATFTPATGYHVENVRINGVDYGPIPTWDFANVAEAQYVVVTFAPNVYQVTTTAFGQGTVSAGETFVYNPENTYTFTAVPAEGYVIGQILRNNQPLYVANPTDTFTQTLTNILSDYDYVVNFVPSTYTVTATAGFNGNITPNGTFSYNYGDEASYTITANEGFYISAITVDGETTTYAQADNMTTFTQTFAFSGANASNHTINATFATYRYSIEVAESAHGTITPGTTVYNYNATPTFAITPEAGYGVADVTVDGVSVGAVTSYIFPALTANHTIAATFAQYQYTITANAGNGGTITPSGVANMIAGGSQTYTITAAAGHHIDQVYVDGAPVGAVSTYAFNDVNANHTIFAAFGVNEYVVTVNQPNNGVITPGTTTVAYQATPTFVITPNTGYNVTAITLNGTNVMANAANNNGVYTYTLPAVTANATLTATMTQKTFTITASAGSHGTITPSGTATVNFGATAAYTITPAAGYVVENVTVDGMTMGAVTAYTFTNVTANHTINATFRLMDCAIPTNMHTTGITTNSATFSWYHPTATSFEVQYKALDAANYTSVAVNGNSYTVAGLNPGTTYVWMVRANCGGSNYSEWSNGNIFTTLKEIDIENGIEDFDVKDLVKVYASNSNVYIVNNAEVQINNVQIFDVYGKLLYSGNVSNNTEVISMNVATGTYVVRLTTEQGTANYKVYLSK